MLAVWFYMLEDNVPLGFFIICFIVSIIYLIYCYRLRAKKLQEINKQKEEAAHRVRVDVSAVFFDAIANVDIPDIDIDL
jgi:hypothetical protein